MKSTLGKGERERGGEKGRGGERRGEGGKRGGEDTCRWPNQEKLRNAKQKRAYVTSSCTVELPRYWLSLVFPDLPYFVVREKNCVKLPWLLLH